MSDCLQKYKINSNIHYIFLIHNSKIIVKLFEVK